VIQRSEDVVAVQSVPPFSYVIICTLVYSTLTRMSMW